MLLIFHSHGVYQLFRLASLAAIAFGVTRLYSMAAAKYLMAKKPTLRVSDLMETSRTIMEDRRLTLFLLELSFAGWWLPMILVCAAVLLLVGYNAYVVCVLLLPVFVRAYMVTARAAFVDDWVGNLVSSADDTASITPKSI